MIRAELEKIRLSKSTDTFYDLIKDFYKEGPEQHDSPTRRLIDHKNTAFDHKKTMKSSVETKGNNVYTYTASPDKSYVIEPHGGPLNYSLVKKNPNKFYDQILN